MGSLQHRAETEKSRCRAWLEGLVPNAQQHGVSVRTTVDVGKPGQLIVELAHNWNADLIVLGLSRRGPLTDRLLESVTSTVARHALCSVMMIHG
jgi:nucleotide-binding universal stress UspA family protein